MNLRTGYFLAGIGEADNKVEYHPGAALKHYFKGWFVLDVVSGIPFDLIDMFLPPEKSTNAAPLKMIKVLRLLRLLKLMRLLKLKEITSGLNQDMVTTI